MIRQLPYGDPEVGRSGDLPFGVDDSTIAGTLPLQESVQKFEIGHDLRQHLAENFNSLDLQLRCNWDGCDFNCSFSRIQDWRSHWASEGCSLPNRNHLHCSFLACIEKDLNFSTLQEAIIHEDLHHGIWVCTADGCDRAFISWRTALQHVLRLQHHESRAGESSVKKMWILQKPNLEEFQYDEARFVNLERPTAQEQIVSHQNPTASSDESIRKYITAQISNLQAFLADSDVSPGEVNRRWLRDSVETVRKSITANSSQTTPQPPLPPRSFFSTSPQPIISSPQFAPPSHSHITPFTQSSRAHTFPRTAQSPPTSSAMQLHTQKTWPHPNLQPPVTEAPQREHKRTPSGRLEPVQEMHLDGPTQRTYFEYMQECCIDAAHTFYMRHQERLDVVTDRKGRRLCYTTHGRSISNKHDLTLPQWTHLLRRLSDAKGLKREMVSRIESFNGEIQPVDEVRHACSKNKEKSDRDILALVQITRCFCWQLRDWEKCEQLDDLYGTIEEAIDIARRERQERRRGQKEVRAVNTWTFGSI